MPEPLRFALPKGRILKQTAPLLAAAGIDLSGVLEKTKAKDRRLEFELPNGDRVLLVKPIDVPTYVERGIASVGVAGYDTLREAARDLYEPVDLGIAKCRLAVAESIVRPPELRPGHPVRVASKYPRCAAEHYRKKGIQAEVIPLWGSVELGAITGMADQIVDLVESGETLRQNQLREVETIFEVSARLVVQPAALKTRGDRLRPLIRALERASGGLAA